MTSRILGALGSNSNYLGPKFDPTPILGLIWVGPGKCAPRPTKFGIFTLEITVFSVKIPEFFGLRADTFLALIYLGVWALNIQKKIARPNVQ